MKKKAIVVVHGMGNQYPMQTATKLVENLFTSKTYSSPERVTGSFDQRKLIGFDEYGNKYDIYEFYWAHMMKEPDLYSTLLWFYKIIFKNNSSERFNKYKAILQYSIPSILILLIWIVHWCYDWILANFIWLNSWQQITILFTPIALYFSIKFFSKTIMQSFGDVFRYTVPHPSNIEVKQKISNSAVEFLTNLHCKFDYSEIIVIGHSLGSIIAYDMLINTFGNLNKDFRDNNGNNKHGISNIEKENVIKTHPQDAKLKSLINLGFRWRVTNFITCGSPLCHAEMILVQNSFSLYNKIIKGEYPVCPPLPNDDFYQPDKEKSEFVPTHSSIFNFVNWVNVYFANDIIGGNLSKIFGNGIVNHNLIPKTYKGMKISHSQYWNAAEESESFEILNKIIKR